MPSEIDVLSLFPEYFQGPLDASMLKRAQLNGKLKIELVNVRDFSEERFRKVDDRPYGGGPGMVMMADPLVKAIRARKRDFSRAIYLSPQGVTLTAKKCRELAKLPHLILVCGHYEGIDQRVIESEIDEEISIGDFVLTNGCLASLVLIDAVSRFIPGVLGDSEAASQDSFESGLLDWPHYTRPEVFEGMKVPEVLLGGNHREITAWRHKKARLKTKEMRPDLWLRYAVKESIDEEKKNENSTLQPQLKKLVLSSREIKKSLAFYQKVFGEIEVTGTGFEVSIEKLQISIVEDSVTEPLILSLQIDEASFLQLARRLKGQKNQNMDMVVGPPGLCVTDPDGNKWIFNVCGAGENNVQK